MLIECPKSSGLRKSHVRKITSGEKISIRETCIPKSYSKKSKKACSQSTVYRKSHTRTLSSGKKVKVKETCAKKTSSPVCKSGYILRDGYHRKEYQKKSGTIVKPTDVKPGCIVARGHNGVKGKKLFALKKGALKMFGYSTSIPKAERQVALNKAIKNSSSQTVIRQLNAVRNLNKYHEKLHKIYTQDMNYVQTKL